MHKQTCRKFESFRGQNLDFQKFPQKCLTSDIVNSQKYWLICNIIKENIRNTSGLDIYDTSIKVFQHSSCQKVVTHRFQSDSFRNHKTFMRPMATTFCMSCCAVPQHIAHEFNVIRIIVWILEDETIKNDKRDEIIVIN